MTLLQLAVIITATVAAVLAFRARERSLGAVLALGAICDVAREALGRFVTRPERERLLALVGGDAWARAPFAGAVRAAFHVDEALYLAWPAGVAVFAMLACGYRRGAAAVVAGWGALVAICAALYPELSGAYAARWSLERFYLGAHLAAVVLSALAFAGWYLRREERAQRRHLAVLILAGAELLVIASGPFAWGGSLSVWTADGWDLSRWIYLSAFTATALVFIRGENLNTGALGR